MKAFLGPCILVAVSACLGFAVSQHPKSLRITYGSRGVERVQYAGSVLLDVNQWPEDAFHIWHMSLSDLSGKDLTKKLGWGENNRGRVWDAATTTWIYSFEWGEIRTKYTQSGDELNIAVTATDRAGSGVLFRGATIYPLTLGGTVPNIPTRGGGERWVTERNEPAILSVPIQEGQLVLSSNETRATVWLGLASTKGGATEAILSTAAPDGLRDAGDNPNPFTLSPGQSATTNLTLRFLPAGSDPLGAASEAINAFRAKWPERLKWTDRRIIGTVYLASAAAGDKSHRSGTSGDPRRFLAGADVDIRKSVGLDRFQLGVLGEAETIVQNLRRLNSQGAITWDLEGQEYPPDTSYVCSPDQIALTAPEMESVVTNRNSKYAGMKLDDAYFRTIRDAGFRVGVCVRPQRFVLSLDGTAVQISLSDAEAVQELIRKMKYAHDRWGATIFYLDSTVRADGSALSSDALEMVAEAMPDSLLIPEESSTRNFRAMAPFATFLFHGDLGTSKRVRSIYPRAFSVNLVNDVDPIQLLTHRKEIVNEVRGGDILMVHADYWQANNATVLDIYQEANRRH